MVTKMNNGNEFKSGYRANLFLQADNESYALIIDSDDSEKTFPIMLADSVNSLVFLASNHIHLSMEEIKSLREYLEKRMEIIKL